jgi:peptidoglycan/LPS O-acetylase OafA/YrhL
MAASLKAGRYLDAEAESASPPHFTGLDGLRGVAAFAILAHHIGLARNQAGLFSHAYLAVDFFFLLSGFVVGLAYEQRMAKGLSFLPFIGARLGRLYPMILLGAVLGVGAALLRPHDFPICVALIAQIAFVPFAASDNDAYPLNNVQWSLLFEILINIVHSVFYNNISTARLAGVVLLSACALIFTDIHFGTLAVGYSRANFWGGFPRVAFSYSVGLFVFRLMHAGRLRRIRLPYIVVAVTLTIILATPAIKGFRDSIFVVAVFPSILVLSLGSPPTRGFCRLATLAGAISYPLYAIHAPLIWVALLVMPKNNIPALHAAFWAATAICILMAAWAAECIYDAPVRRWLRSKGAVAVHAARKSSDRFVN